MKNDTAQNSQSTLFGLRSLIWTTGVLLSILMFMTLKVHYDNLQIMDKVYKILNQGEWSHFGNFGSGVGFLPGTLTTLLTAVPMMLVNSPYSAMFLILIFHILSTVLLLKAARELELPNAAMTWLLLLFWLNPWRVEQAELYNPAYLFLFSTVHLYSALRLRNEKSLFWTFIHTLNIGLCGQVHFSALILCFTSLLLWRKKQVLPHLAGLALGVLVSIVSLIPYLMALIDRPEIGMTVHHSNQAYLGRNLILVYPLAKAILYWLRYGSFYFGRHIFSEVHFQYLGLGSWDYLLQWSYRLFLYPLALVSFVFSVRLQWRLLRQVPEFLKSLLYKQKSISVFRESSLDPGLNVPRKSNEWLHQYYLCFFLGMIGAAALSPVEFNHWHLILAFPLITLVMTSELIPILSQKTKLWNPSHTKRLFIFLLVWMTLHGVLMGLGSRSHSIFNRYDRDLQKHYESN